jgi:Domain of unknown function (DUF6916)
MSLAELTAASFTDRIQDAFVLSAPTGTLKLVLTEVEELGQSQHRRAFALRFLGPPKPILPQAIYRLDHPAMGALEIFLVPLGPKDGGMCYEAVFT